MPPRVTLDNVLARGQRQPPTTLPVGCLLWTGKPRHADGYGQVKVNGRQERVHRWVYEQTHEVSLPPEVLVRHECDTPLCIEITHLIEGSSADNNRDRMERGGYKRLDMCQAGRHPMTPENTYTVPSTGDRSCRACTRARKAHRGDG